MPINLIDYTGVSNGQKGRVLGHLCEDQWEMPVQIEALESWLVENQQALPKGAYVADLGFSPRKGAAGGGAVLTSRAIGIMASIGLELYLSEYPELVDEPLDKT